MRHAVGQEHAKDLAGVVPAVHDIERAAEHEIAGVGRFALPEEPVAPPECDDGRRSSKLLARIAGQRGERSDPGQVPENLIPGHRS